MGSGSSRPNFARSCWAISGGTLGLAASSWKGSPGASATTEKSTTLMPSSAGTAISSRRTTYLDMAWRRGSRARARPPRGRSPLAVPERHAPEVGVPARDVGALQPVGDGRHHHAPQHRDDDGVLDDEVVHLDEVRRPPGGIHLGLGGLPYLVVFFVPPARDVPALELVGLRGHLPRRELVHEPLWVWLGHG